MLVPKPLPSAAGHYLLRQSKLSASGRKLSDMPMALPLGATATTAASGGNREELLGQRPARRKRSVADAGCRNPALSAKQTERLRPSHKINVGRSLFFLHFSCCIHLFVRDAQIYQLRFVRAKPNIHTIRPIIATVLRKEKSLIK